ncbi:MAG TPA: tyrosine--tRNA ligase [Candidatus Saccharimonadales bacterium]|jgi:tyrosyl-tRNA synthetase
MDDIFNRRVAKVLPNTDGLAKKMEEGKIRVYLGIDPSGGQLHIGHAIGIRKLMEFANAGHEAILLFGTGTVLVGDPSERDTGRKTVTKEEIEQNIQTWKDQVAPIIDFDKVAIKQNGDWLTKLTIQELIGIASNISAVQLFKRDSFTRRIDQGDTVWYHETMYPLFQGYDSVVMDVDLEIGGTDQEFNMLIGRELQKKMNDREKYVLTTPMILGTDGQQMSKTSGNCVWLQDPPAEMFGKLMSVADAQIIPYLELCTDVPLKEVNELKSQLEGDSNPKDIKQRMAWEITKIWHDEGAANQAKEEFESRFSAGELPSDIETTEVKTGERNLADLLVETGLSSSKSEARRLIEQGGVRINQDKVESGTVNVNSGDVLQAGKHRFIRIG